MIGPTDGNLYALTRYLMSIEEHDAQMTGCPDCNGTGEIEVMTHGRGCGDPDGIYAVDTCETCRGTGEVEAEEC